MSTAREKKTIDSSTQDKIKEAARKVFHEKGYAATRTRDIADAAGINLALLNYYFRSKDKLFELIMFETMAKFMHAMKNILHDENTSLEEKTEQMAEHYIETIGAEPSIPLFIISEMHRNATGFLERVPIDHVVKNSAFVKQLQSNIKLGKTANINPIHYIINLMGIIVFPFVASPILKRMGDVNDKQFKVLMQERKQLIPIWAKAMLKAK